MREISIFKSEPIYHMGETSNLKKLEKKLAEDNIILSAIEKDYLQDNNKFEEEYFCAKKNYLEKNIFFVGSF